MKHLRDIALASAAIICGSNSAANAEKWSCDFEKSGKTFKHEWIVSDDKMFTPKGTVFARIVQNDNDILFAFFRLSFEKDLNGRPTSKPSNDYVMIVKKTGMAIQFDDILADVNYGPEPEQWTPPVVHIGLALECGQPSLWFRKLEPFPLY
jgi:hypothetical protein